MLGRRYVVANGVRLHALEAGDPGDPLVLFLHGFPQLAYAWRHQLGPVAAAGYHAVAIDLPGYGRSDKPDVDYDIVWLTDTVAGVVRALRARADTARAVVVGHDWGGIIVWTLARRHPSRVAGVVGVNTPDLPRPPEPPVELMRRYWPERPNYMVQFQERGVAEFFAELDVRGFLHLLMRTAATVKVGAFPDEVLDVYVDAFEPRGALTPAFEYYRCMDRNWELTADHDALTVEAPSLMVMAESDPVLTPAMAEGMEARVPDLEKVLVRDCGHFTPEEQPGALTDSVLHWLARRGPFGSGARSRASN